VPHVHGPTLTLRMRRCTQFQAWHDVAASRTMTLSAPHSVHRCVVAASRDEPARGRPMERAKKVTDIPPVTSRKLVGGVDVRERARTSRPAQRAYTVTCDAAAADSCASRCGGVRRGIVLRQRRVRSVPDCDCEAFKGKTNLSKHSRGRATGTLRKLFDRARFHAWDRGSQTSRACCSSTTRPRT
jgi:hypothetical protein